MNRTSSPGNFALSFTALRDLAGLEKRVELLLKRLADVGQLGRPAVADQLLDRAGESRTD